MESAPTVRAVDVLGEQLDRLSIGAAGQREDDGTIATILGKEGHVFYGPYVHLPPGRYSARLAFVETRLPAHSAQRVAVVEAARGEEHLSSLVFDETSFACGVVALPFHLKPSEQGSVSGLEIRLYANGGCALTVTSVDLRRIYTSRAHVESNRPDSGKA